MAIGVSYERINNCYPKEEDGIVTGCLCKKKKCQSEIPKVAYIGDVIHVHHSNANLQPILYITSQSFSEGYILYNLTVTLESLDKYEG